MCEGVVLQVGVVQDVPLHTVVGGEITKVDQGSSPHIGPAASPESEQSGLLENFPDKKTTVITHQQSVSSPSHRAASKLP